MIPRILHRIWIGDAPIPDAYEAFWAEWVAMHPSWSHMTHDGSRIKNRALFAKLTTLSAKSDLLRYEILSEHGGVYVDTDFQPLRPLDPLLDMGLQAFAGWEDHQRVCTALLGAEQGHAAVEALVKGLPRHAQINRNKTPDIQTGPVWLTNTWRGRHDVTLFPPALFYPVSYWEKDSLPRETYPDTAFAVHHWAGSWMPEDLKRRDNAAMAARNAPTRTVAIIVPRKADGGPRDASWAWLRQRWEDNFPEAEIIEGETDPFSRSSSINLAAARTKADVLVIADSDSWCDPAAIRTAIESVDDYVIPWRLGYKLTRGFTEEMLSRHPLKERLTRDKIRRHLEEPEHHHLSGVVVVSRDAFEAVGGFDARFTGWGFEDTAFIYAMDARAGRTDFNPRGPASLIHFWHPAAPDQGHPAEESVALFNEYRAARGVRPWRRGVDR